MNNIEHTTAVGDNIFAELGLEDAANLRIRAELMLQIRQYHESTGQKQAETAKALGTTQPRLNDVLKGHIDKCTIDRLVSMLDAVGHEVKVEVSRAA